MPMLQRGAGPGRRSPKARGDGAQPLEAGSPSPWLTGWSWPGLRAWGLLFLGLFLAIHWQEVTSPTFNVDDWGLVGQPIDQSKQSRPAWDLLYPLLFQNSFSPFFGWLLAAFSLYAVAAATAVFLPLISPAWACLLALLLSLHSYLLDLFNFSFAIGLYLLPAALSIWGGVLIAYGPPRPLLGRRWLDGGLGVAMQVVALGIYQPTGALAVVLFGWQALALALGQGRWGRRAALRLAGGILAGGLLYYAWALLARLHEQANERTGFADPSQLLAKLFDLEIYRQIYATQVTLAFPFPQAALSLLAGLALLLLTLLVGTGRLGAAARGRRLALLWGGALLLVIQPLLLYAILRADFPPRAFCLANLGIASLLVITLATVQPLRWGRSLSRGAVALLVALYLVPQAAHAARVWELTHLMERRDMALAQAILADVRSEARRTGTVAEPFALFGTTVRNEPFQHWATVGESAFRQTWSLEGIFRQLLGVKVQHIPYRQEGNEMQVRATLPACAAYPDAGSIVRHRGGWLVCLEANPREASSQRGDAGPLAAQR